MGFDIGGIAIASNALNGVTLNTSLIFNSAGQGSASVASTATGYCGSQNGGSNYYAPASGWPVNATNWGSGINLANGVFTCPVTGLYAVGWDGIHNGGSAWPSAAYNTYGYGAFARNGSIAYWVHVNMGNAGTAGMTSWHSGGSAMLFKCIAGDTLALFINQAPTSAPGDTHTQNTGLYPNGHHEVWVKFIG